MHKQSFFVNSNQLKYSEDESNTISNTLSDRYESSETPSVFYLNLKYEDETYLPLSLFRNKLTPLQAIVKYLRENLGKSNKQTALLLSRDPKTVWLTYDSVKKKKVPDITDITRPRVEPGLSEIEIPLSIFRNRKLSIQESLVLFLKHLDLKYSVIARLINRDQRTIWTAHHRAKQKTSSSKKRAGKKRPRKKAKQENDKNKKQTK